MTQTRRFVVIGQKATSTGEFLLEDVAGTSGRLDVLLRCVRAALLTSHGLRPGVIVYLLLLGAARAPRIMRYDSANVKFVRPDERNLAVQARKALESHADEAAPGFVEVRAGISVAQGGIETILTELRGSALYTLEEGAPDVRDDADFGKSGDIGIFLGDHTGFSDEIRGSLAAAGARPIGLGPTSVHSDDALAIVQNELDRRA